MIINEILGRDFYLKNRFVFASAIDCGMVLCGGVASALLTKKVGYEPSDIDFVTDDINSANSFVSMLSNKLIVGRSHFRVAYNSHNEFCPNGVDVHIRFTSSMWSPLCVFIKPSGGVSHFYIKKFPVKFQKLSDIKSAAKEMEEIDGRARIAADSSESDKSSGFTIRKKRQ